MIRQTVLVIVLFMFVRCAATVPMAAAADDATAKRFDVPSGKAAIYVVRKKQGFGSAILFRCAVDGKLIGGIGPGTYRVVYVDPGVHTVTVFGNENEEARDVDAQSGKDYFVVVHARTGMVSARVGLDAETSNGRAVVAASALAK